MNEKRPTTPPEPNESDDRFWWLPAAKEAAKVYLRDPEDAAEDPQSGSPSAEPEQSSDTPHPDQEPTPEEPTKQ